MRPALRPMAEWPWHYYQGFELGQRHGRAAWQHIPFADSAVRVTASYDSIHVTLA
jgi:hypothetical protein